MLRIPAAMRPLPQPFDGPQDPRFVRESGVTLGSPWVAGNRVDALENGCRIFPAMLEAIGAAEASVNFETFIYWTGRIGHRFAEAFADRARAGVEVRVLLDWLGCRDIDPQLVATMEEAGVRVRRFHPPRWGRPRRANHRTHRKWLLVDGRVGFTGGVGIADQWDGDGDGPAHWRDSHYRFEGPVVAHMQSVFLDTWLATTGELLQGPRHFPPLSAAGDSVCQVFASSPHGGSDSMRRMVALLLAAARERIDLAAAYFVPDLDATRGLLAAAARGVRVRALVPGPCIDYAVVRRASRAGWGELLQAGIEIHEFQPTVLHRKGLLIDGRLFSVGSTNFDPRSFHLNFEASVNIADSALGATAAEVFEHDLARSRQVTLQAWQQRPLREKLLEQGARLLSRQL